MHPPIPPAENLARDIVTWLVASVFGQKTEGQEPLELVSAVHVLGPEMGVLVIIALPSMP